VAGSQKLISGGGPKGEEWWPTIRTNKKRATGAVDAAKHKKSSRRMSGVETKTLVIELGIPDRKKKTNENNLWGGKRYKFNSEEGGPQESPLVERRFLKKNGLMGVTRTRSRIGGNVKKNHKRRWCTCR